MKTCKVHGCDREVSANRCCIEHQAFKSKCGALADTGKPCRKSCMPNGRCDRHGGKTPVGYDLPQTKHAKYSKYIPTRMLEQHEAFLNDPERLSLVNEIALIDARIADLLTRVDTGESGRLWKRAKDAYSAYRKGVRDKDFEAQAVALNDLGVVLGQGVSDTAAWEEISRLVERRRRLADSERKRMVDAQLVLTVDKAMTVANALLEAVRTNVKEPDRLAAIQADFVRLLHADNSGGVNKLNGSG